MEYEDDEYEIVATSPVRRLENRVAKVEAVNTASEVRRLIEQIIELIKANQRVIDDVIKSDAELRNEVSKIPNKIDQLLSTMNDFIEILKASATDEIVHGGGASTGNNDALVGKMNELIEVNKKTADISERTNQTNQTMITSLDTIEKRLKRLHLEFAAAFRR